MIKGFNEAAYLACNQDIVKAGVNPKQHFKNRGIHNIAASQRQFHKDFQPFDEKLYLEAFPNIQKEIKKKHPKFGSAFEHFCLYGYTEIIAGTRKWPKVKKTYTKDTQKEEIKPETDKEYKKLFNTEYYRALHPSIKQDPFEYYLTEGRFKNHSFSPVYNPQMTAKLVGECACDDLFLYWYTNELEKKTPCSHTWKFYLELTDKGIFKSTNSLQEQFADFVDLFNRLGVHNDYEALMFLGLLSPFLLQTDETYNTSTLKLIRQWLDSGSKTPFSVFFDKQYYEILSHKSFKNEKSAFLHWCKDHKENRTVPTPLVNIPFYTTVYKDLETLENSFEHFILHGQYHNLTVSPFFDPGDFSSYASEPTSSLYAQWLSGALGENVPNPKLETVIKQNFSHPLMRKETVNLFTAFMNIFNNASFSSTWEAKLFLELLDIREIDHTFNNTVEHFIQILEKWKDNNFEESFSTLFDKHVVFKKMGIKTPSQLSAFHEWFTKGIREHIVPTNLFDTDFYLMKNPDLKQYDGFLFMHYLHHGKNEGRTAHPLLNLAWIASVYGCQKENAYDYYFHCERNHILVKPSQEVRSLIEPEFTKQYKKKTLTLREVADFVSEKEIFDFRENSVIREMIQKASKIDPLIQVNDPNRVYCLTPLNSDYGTYFKYLPEIIGTPDILIFRDALNFGGADVVLSKVYQSLKQEKRNIKIKILVFGECDFDALSSFGIATEDVIDIPSTLSLNWAPMFPEIAYDIIMGVKPKVIYNLNCQALWDTIENYGKILKHYTQLKAFMFCDDRDAQGNVAGYPASYFISCSPFVEHFFFDSHYLLDRIKERTVNTSMLNKISILSTPLEKVNINKNGSFGIFKKKKNVKRIGWAGRFDEQKRPDILKEIALALPDLEFYVWGKAVLSQKKYDLEGVENIQLMGLYKDPLEILDAGCDMFLYTSEWDGVPTILLRMLELGSPILASRVGGVPEVIPEIGLIDDFKDIKTYCEKIEYFSKHYAEVVDIFHKQAVELSHKRDETNFSQTLLGGIQ